MRAYLDASAAVKLLRREDESDALRGFLPGRDPAVAAEFLVVEMVCAIRRRHGGSAEIARAHRLSSDLDLVPLDDRVRELACLPHDPPQRALNAIHLGTALALRERLEALVTYDRSLAAAAEAHGLPVVSPA